MEDSQVSNDKPKEGCGCGNENAKVTYTGRPPLTEQQEKLLARVQRTNQRKNSIYKTNTRYFM